MKFLCPNCKAKYRIGPEKLQGRQVAKIRCRKCGVRIHIARKAGSDDFDISATPATGAPPAAKRESRSRSAKAATLKRPPVKEVSSEKTRGAAGFQAKGSETGAVEGPVPGLPGIRGSRDRPLGRRGGALEQLEPVGARGSSGGQAMPLQRGIAVASVSKEKTRPSDLKAARDADLLKATPGSAPPVGVAAPSTSSRKHPSLSSAPDSAAPVPSSDLRAATDQGDEATDGWFVGVNGVPLGPIPVADLAELAVAGHIDQRSLVWREGFSEWRPLGKFAHLVHLLGEETGASERSKKMAVEGAEREASSVHSASPSSVEAAAPSRNSSDANSPSPSEAPSSTEQEGSGPQDVAAGPAPLVGASPWEDEDDEQDEDQPTTIRGRTSPPSEAASRASDAPSPGLSAVSGTPSVGASQAPPALRVPPPAPVPAYGSARPLPSRPPVAAAGPSASVIEELNSLSGGGNRKVSPWVWVGVVVAVVLVAAGMYQLGASQSGGVSDDAVKAGSEAEGTTSAPNTAELNPAPTAGGADLKSLAGGTSNSRKQGAQAPAATKSPSKKRKARATARKGTKRKAAASKKKGSGLLSGLDSLGTTGPSSRKTSKSKSAGRDGLDSASIERTVRKNIGAVKRSCWERGLRASGTPSSARVVVALEIAPNGKVKSAKSRPPKGFASLGRCIESRVRKWRFRRSAGATSVKVPFMFVGQ